MDAEVDDRIADAEVLEPDLVQPRRQPWPEQQTTTRRVRLEGGECADEGHDGSRRPRLGNVGTEGLDGETARVTRQAGEQLGQAPGLEAVGGVEDRARGLGG